MDMYILKIKEFRKTKKLTQKQLAERVGISRSFLGELENGKWDIGLDLLIKISISLEIHYSDLISRK
jgi:transcriptional regulator with XRE-family HTH domain